MPELPEVETVRRGLEKQLLGGLIEEVELHRENLRYPFPPNFVASLVGKKIIEIVRRAKYLLIRLDDDTTWLVHLGMTGKFTLFESDREFQAQGGVRKHDHVVVKIDTGRIAVYNDPRRFGIMDHIAAGGEQNHRLLAGIGCEPLSEDFSASHFFSLVKERRVPIKTALLDQKIVAGLGNIYVCEILHRAGVSPRRLACNLGAPFKSPTVSAIESDGLQEKNLKPHGRIPRIVEETKLVLMEAIKAGGSTISDFAAVDGDLGYFAHSFTVYGKEGEACSKTNCAGIVKRIVQSGRSTFFCSQCQR